MGGTLWVMKLTTQIFKPYFPFPVIRQQQQVALDFLNEAFINEDKKFVILEAGTGVGKSAVGYCFASFMNANTLSSAYFLTTQKILQEQYIKDFGAPKGPMCSISSSSNYGCTFHANQTLSKEKMEMASLVKETKMASFKYQ